MKDSPLILKIDHTHRVRRNIRGLAKALELTDSDQCTAETIGLLHDVGRFEQYRRFGTFDDRRSVNHAALGIDVVHRERVLADLTENDHRLVVGAIHFHNAPALPSHRPPGPLTFMRLIRDADKLDIWKIFAAFYRRDEPIEAAVVQHLVDRPTWEPAIVEAILKKRLARFSKMKSINDFKLLQLSWVFDLSFPETFGRARKRGDLALIAGTLPKDPELKPAIALVLDHLERMATGSQDRNCRNQR